MVYNHYIVLLSYSRPEVCHFQSNITSFSSNFLDILLILYSIRLAIWHHNNKRIRVQAHGSWFDCQFFNKVVVFLSCNSLQLLLCSSAYQLFLYENYCDVWRLFISDCILVYKIILRNTENWSLQFWDLSNKEQWSIKKSLVQMNSYLNCINLSYILYSYLKGTHLFFLKL